MAISGTVLQQISGNGLHLYRATPFGVTSPEKQLMTVTTTEANNIADLPRICRHGYTVRIVNSGEDMDDYYLKFYAEGVTDTEDNPLTKQLHILDQITLTISLTSHGFSVRSSYIRCNVW